jgi:PLP dependent protein
MVNEWVDIAANLRQVRERIAEAALRSQRDPQKVELVAVTKMFPVEMIVEAWEAGQRHFGENRPEEGADKIPSALRLMLAGPPAGAPIWHMIGHVQSRKADLVVAHFDIVHSIDRLKIAQKLNDLAAGMRRCIPVMMECNVSGEAGKYGYPAAAWQEEPAVREQLYSEVASLVELPYLQVVGLMTMAPIAEDPEAVRPVFASLRGLRDWLREQFPEVDWSQLSMGMTDDYAVAVEEGATIVRVGRGIFGARL